MIYNDPMFWPRKKPQKVTLTMTGNGNKMFCFAAINGTNYYSAGEIEVNKGDTVYCYVHDDMQSGSSAIKLNGVGVGVELSGGFGNYEYNYAAQNATIAFSFNPMTASITITEES